MKKEIEKSIIIKELTLDLDFETLDNIQKWKLFNVAIWEKIYNVKIS